MTDMTEYVSELKCAVSDAQRREREATERAEQAEAFVSKIHDIAAYGLCPGHPTAAEMVACAEAAYERRAEELHGSDEAVWKQCARADQAESALSTATARIAELEAENARLKANQAPDPHPFGCGCARCIATQFRMPKPPEET